MCRITDPEKSRAFYEALGFAFAGDFDIVRNGELEATNYFFSLGDQESVLELTYNHDGRTYELGSGYGHIATAAEDLDWTLERLAAHGIEPERPPYTVREAARGCVSSKTRRGSSSSWRSRWAKGCAPPPTTT
jgi:lactoylglutathione lyase